MDSRGERGGQTGGGKEPCDPRRAKEVLGEQRVGLLNWISEEKFGEKKRWVLDLPI